MRHNARYGKLAKAFSTARWPEQGKPMKNNNRLFQEESSRFGIGYRWEHFGSGIFTMFRHHTIIHTGAQQSMTSRERIGEAGLRVYSDRDDMFLVMYPGSYMWSDHDLLIYDDEQVYTEYPSAVRNAEGHLVRGPTEYRLLHPVEKVGAPRKLPKSRNTIRDPKKGDAFMYQGKPYIWARIRGKNGLHAFRYFGDNTWNRAYVHVPETETEKNIVFSLLNGPLEMMAYAARTEDMTPIERFEHSDKCNPVLEDT